jgi:mannose-1-phosphate guanylyltransferase
MKNSNYCVIMAGGIGSRFWPMSTPNKPKQFLDVLGIGKSLLQMTYDRLKSIAPEQNIFILTNANYADLVKEQLPRISSDQILCEPMRKNTAPCIAYAAAKIKAIDTNATLIVSPSDHLIIQEQRFEEIINIAINSAEQNKSIVTLGIQPTRPDTGYGYIECNKNENVLGGEVLSVNQFREKPNLETAIFFLNEGNYLWNSGIFIWQAETVLDALSEYQPNLYQLFAGDLSYYGTDREQAKVNEAFEKCEDISIDYAVMEHAKNLEVVVADFDWSDLGTWGSLIEHLPKKDAENAIIGKHVHLFQSKNCMINVPDNKLVVLDGLENYIVVESDNMLLVLKSENEQLIKEYLKVAEQKSPDFFK